MGSRRRVGLGVVGALAAFASCNQVLGNEEGHLAESGGAAGTAGAAGDGGPDGGDCIPTLQAATASSLGGHDKMKWASQLAPQASLNKSSVWSAARVGGQVVACGVALEVMVGPNKVFAAPNVVARLDPSSGAVLSALSTTAPDCRVAGLGGTSDVVASATISKSAAVFNTSVSASGPETVLANIHLDDHFGTLVTVEGDAASRYLVTRPQGGFYLGLSSPNKAGSSVFAFDQGMNPVQFKATALPVTVNALATSAGGSLYVAFGSTTSTVQFVDGPSVELSDPASARVLAKYSATGAYLWHKVFQGVSAIDVAAVNQRVSVVVTSNSSKVAVEGTAETACTAGSNSFLFQYDDKGTLRWARSFAGGGWHVAQTDADVYLSGSRVDVDGKSVAVKDSDVVVHVTDDGKLAWIQTLETGHAAGLASISSGGAWAYGMYTGTFDGPTKLTGAPGGTDFVAAF